MMKISQYITAGQQFNGAAPNGTYSTGGLFQIPSSGSDDVVARIRRLTFKTPGTLTSFVWSQQVWDSGHLAYSASVNPFHVGRKATGQTSGATAMIVRDDVAGSALYLAEVTKGPVTGQTFQNGETVIEDGGAPQGEATAGIYTPDLVAIDTGDSADADYELAFGSGEGILDVDQNAGDPGTPVPVIFVSVGLTAEAAATLYYDYIRLNANTEIR